MSYEFFYNFFREQLDNAPESENKLMLIRTLYASMCNTIADFSENIEISFINCTKAYRTFYDEYCESHGI